MRRVVLAQKLGTNPLENSEGHAMCNVFSKKEGWEVLKLKKGNINIEKEGLEIAHVYEVIAVRKIENKVIVGYLTTKLQKNIPWVPNSVDMAFVKPEYRGRKIGIALYLAAIQIHSQISSSELLSINSVRVWHALTKYHKVRLYQTPGYTEVKYRWGADGVPKVDGHSIQDSDYYDYIFFISSEHPMTNPRRIT